jgi:hypothetical protein
LHSWNDEILEEICNTIQKSIDKLEPKHGIVSYAHFFVDISIKKGSPEAININLYNCSIFNLWIRINIPLNVKYVMSMIIFPRIIKIIVLSHLSLLETKRNRKYSTSPIKIKIYHLRRILNQMVNFMGCFR